MIKFFRRIRQKLLSKGHIRKYLAYATGEVLLVVIGILIALQINNWNEKRKKTAYVEALIDKVEQDLVTNVQRAHRAFHNYASVDSLIKDIVLRRPSKQEFLENEALRSAIISNLPFHPVQENLTKLLEVEEDVPARYSIVLSSLKQFLNDELEKGWERTINMEEANQEFLAMKFGPYGRTPEALATRLDYYMTEDFRNRLSLVRDRNSQYLFKIAYYRSHCLATLAQIKRIRNQYTIREVKELFRELGMKPFQALNCDEEAIITEYNVRERHLVYNFSSDTIRLTENYIDSPRPFHYTIEPNGFRTFTFIPQPIFNDYTRIIKVLGEGDCKSKFVSRRNGYLFIE
ncbi:MAG: hypothetical protein F6K19_20480 [Cyanothece sp. SIO1E1]|nr:hypothetical protein [Cyanothece sp. SIO1E1]